ncbi:MAG: tripartite tricarboxylate transporter substrate binding protein [Xanthobacteraceae bacterium]|jgi:tripartite-type tricarboxylate transporter receptor subunit TctC
MVRTLCAIALAVLIVPSSLPSASAQAEQYPARPIRILVGFGPGSSADVVARVVGKQMEEKLGQPVVVENRPGNSSMTAAEATARAPNDGYMLFMATVAQTINPVFTHSDFNLAKELSPIALLGVVPNVLVAHPSVPANNVRELVALAKAKPDTLTFGTSGAGTASHLAAELFNLKAGTKILPVHYAGGSNQAMVDLLAGRITLMFNVAATLAPQVEKGNLKALGMAQPKRAAIMPKVPTMEEQGMPGFDAGIWIGLLAPAGTPAPIIEALSQSANAALKTEPVSTALKTQGIDPLGGTPEQFRDFIAADIERWSTVVHAAGLSN